MFKLMKLFSVFVILIFSFFLNRTYAEEILIEDLELNQLDNSIILNEDKAPLEAPEETEYLNAKVVEIIDEDSIEIEGKIQIHQKIKISLLEGNEIGKEVIVENGATNTTQLIQYKKGDEVIVSFVKNLNGEEIFYITDIVRTNAILVLFILFVILAILVGGKKGFSSLLAMVASFVILFLFILPQIQSGKDPVITAIFASIIIIPITFYLSHGFNRKTTIAMIGSFGSLIITGILASLFVEFSHLTGTASEEAIFLQMSNEIQYNLKGLLLAGIIIGTLGVMDDITISQTSICFQLYDLKNDLSFKELFTRSIKIGKDHIASMINTLILVYTGASMPLLLLFMNNPRPFDEILNYEMISTEIVRTLVGSIGLILAVPITTYLACYFVKKQKRN